MSMSNLTVAQQQKLWDDFRYVCAHENMSPESVKVAWESATMCAGKAAACYAAIVRSFGPAPGEVRRRYD